MAAVVQRSNRSQIGHESPHTHTGAISFLLSFFLYFFFAGAHFSFRSPSDQSSKENFRDARVPGRSSVAPIIDAHKFFQESVPPGNVRRFVKFL